MLRGSCVVQHRHVRSPPPPRGGRAVRCRSVRASGAEDGDGASHGGVTRRALGAGAGLMLSGGLYSFDTDAHALGRPLSDRIVSRDLRNSVRCPKRLPTLSDAQPCLTRLRLNMIAFMFAAPSHPPLPADTAGRYSHPHMSGFQRAAQGADLSGMAGGALGR